MWSHSSTAQHVHLSKGRLEGTSALRCCGNTASNIQGLEPAPNQSTNSVHFRTYRWLLTGMRMCRVGQSHQEKSSGRHNGILSYLYCKGALTSACASLSSSTIHAPLRSHRHPGNHQTISCHPSVYITPRAAAAIRMKCRLLVSAYGAPLVHRGLFNSTSSSVWLSGF